MGDPSKGTETTSKFSSLPTNTMRLPSGETEASIASLVRKLRGRMRPLRVSASCRSEPKEPGAGAPKTTLRASGIQENGQARWIMVNGSRGCPAGHGITQNSELPSQREAQTPRLLPSGENAR